MAWSGSPAVSPKTWYQSKKSLIASRFNSFQELPETNEKSCGQIAEKLRRNRWWSAQCDQIGWFSYKSSPNICWPWVYLNKNIIFKIKNLTLHWTFKNTSFNDIAKTAFNGWKIDFQMIANFKWKNFSFFLQKVGFIMEIKTSKSDRNFFMKSKNC